MRIAVLAPVWFPVPPSGYGGIEWIVALLADGLVDAGHDVTLFASGDSRTKARLVSAFAEARTTQIRDSVVELTHALACYSESEAFDVINDHSGAPLGAALGGLVPTPVLHTVHAPLDATFGPAYERVASLVPSVGFISLSFSQRKPLPALPWVANIPNALDLAAFPVLPSRGDYLLFLSRLSPEKGAHRAIEVANEAGLPLRIAGKMHHPSEQAYFEEHVRPRLRSGIEYLGEVGHREKVELLQNARATLFPIEWEEPFGLVMIESMACGTPVIATRRGAVPEVIEPGRSGVVVDDYREMAAALAEADRLDPLECRRYVEERFAPERMVRDYEAAYRLVSEQVVA